MSREGPGLWREAQIANRVVTSVDDHFVVEHTVRLVGHDSGVPVEQRIHYTYLVRDGKIAAIAAHASEGEAVDAVGAG